QLRRASAVVRPDVVHVHGFRLDIGDAAAVAAGDGHPVVYTEHAALAEGDDHFPLVPDCDWEVLVAVDVICCVSVATCDVLQAVVPDATPVRRASHVVGPAPQAPRRAPGG